MIKTVQYSELSLVMLWQNIAPWIQNPDVGADLYAMFSAVAAPIAYFAAQL